MRAKKYLSQARWLDKMIDNKIRYQERLRTLAEKTTIDISRERVSGGNTVNSREDIIVKLADISHEVNADIDRLIDLEKEIMETIGQVKDGCLKIILISRYVNGMGWDEIALEMKYEKSWIMRLHGKALVEIDKVLNARSN